VVDPNPEHRSICVVPSSKEVPPVPPDPPVCYPSDASFDVSRPEAGTTAPDADATTPVPDVAADSPPADRRGDTAGDLLDSSRVETGADIAPDARGDNEETSSDASDESSEDVTTPGDADGTSDVGADAADAGPDAADAGPDADVSVD
jgi:hypothetical protein